MRWRFSDWPCRFLFTVGATAFFVSVKDVGKTKGDGGDNYITVDNNLLRLDGELS